MQSSGADQGIADLVLLPGAGEGDVAGLELELPAADDKSVAAALLKHQLDAFVAVPTDTPGLRVGGIHETDEVHARQVPLSQAAARIVPAAEAEGPQLAGLEGAGRGLQKGSFKNGTTVRIAGQGHGRQGRNTSRALTKRGPAPSREMTGAPQQHVTRRLSPFGESG